jgi:hypothetical protein
MPNTRCVGQFGATIELLVDVAQMKLTQSDKIAFIYAFAMQKPSEADEREAHHCNAIGAA